MFFFQFSGFESLAIFSPQKSISDPIFTLKRGKFPNFSQKKLLSLRAENSPKKTTGTNSSFYSVLFQRTSGSSLVLKSFKYPNSQFTINSNTRHKTDSHPLPHLETPFHMDSLPDTFQLPIFKS